MQADALGEDALVSTKNDDGEDEMKAESRLWALLQRHRRRQRRHRRRHRRRWLPWGDVADEMQADAWGEDALVSTKNDDGEDPLGWFGHIGWNHHPRRRRHHHVRRNWRPSRWRHPWGDVANEMQADALGEDALVSTKNDDGEDEMKAESRLWALLQRHRQRPKRRRRPRRYRRRPRGIWG